MHVKLLHLSCFSCGSDQNNMYNFSSSQNSGASYYIPVSGFQKFLFQTQVSFLYRVHENLDSSKATRLVVIFFSSRLTWLRLLYLKQLFFFSPPNLPSLPKYGNLTRFICFSRRPNVITKMGFTNGKVYCNIMYMDIMYRM